MEDLQDIYDETEDQLDDTDELREEQLEQYGTFPESKEQQNIYNWFWKVVNLDASEKVVKVGNLNNQEIGSANIPVREAMNLALLGNIFGHKKFANYFNDNAKIISATSMAKKGWFMDLSISQKKVRQRSKSSSGESWRIFNKKGKVQEED